VHQVLSSQYVYAALLTYYVFTWPTHRHCPVSRYNDSIDNIVQRQDTRHEAAFCFIYSYTAIYVCYVCIRTERCVNQLNLMSSTSEQNEITFISQILLPSWNID